MCCQLRKGFDVNLTTGLKLNFFIKFPHWIVLKIHADFPMPCSPIPMLFSGSPVSHFLFYLLFSLFPLPSGRHASGNQESWQFPSLKSVPRQFPLVLTQPSPPRRLFWTSESVTQKILSSSRQRISEHCWVCDLISHIGHAREKPSPLLKISWKPGTCKPRWDFCRVMIGDSSRYNLVPVSLFFFHGDRFLINMRVLVLIFVWKTRRKTSARS